MKATIGVHQSCLRHVCPVVLYFCILLILCFLCLFCRSELYYFCISASCLFFIFNYMQAHNSVSTELPEVCVSWVWSPLWHWLTRILGVRTNQPTGNTSNRSNHHLIILHQLHPAAKHFGISSLDTMASLADHSEIEKKSSDNHFHWLITQIIPEGGPSFCRKYWRLTGLTPNVFSLQMIRIIHMGWPFAKRTFWCTE